MSEIKIRIIINSIVTIFIIILVTVSFKQKSTEGKRHITLQSSIDSLVVSNKRLEKKINVIYPYFIGAE